MNPNVFPTYPPDISQQHAQLQQLNANLEAMSITNSADTKQNMQDPLINIIVNNDDGQKRELEVESGNSDQPIDKKLKSRTVSPEQLDYLDQMYLIESRPSKEMRRNIAREVGLVQRVVQVWFQNKRARERRGPSERAIMATRRSYQ